MPRYEKAVREGVKVPINQNQFDALLFHLQRGRRVFGVYLIKGNKPKPEQFPRN